ncbi:MAG: ribosome small subunit-dependent GTPase A [Bacteroidota bacterium]
MKYEGLVMRSTGSWYEVQTADDELFKCRLKGKFKIKGLKTSNPIAVGDRVVFDNEGEEAGTAVISEILPRFNYIIRKSVHKTAQGHILAANLDQAVLIVTYVFPRTSLGFIDRFLVTAESFRIPVKIIFNKSDLLKPKDTEIVNGYCKLYESLGYQCFITSAEQEIGIEAFRELFKNKVSLIAGHSGVGKSTLVNRIAPDLQLPTTEVSTFANKGVHTTTFATMFQLAENSYIIDSPGIKELGLIDVEKEEISHFFPEMRDLFNKCKYHNCIHVNEPKCAVIEAVMNGDIAESRYKSYLSMLEGDDNRR